MPRDLIRREAAARGFNPDIAVAVATVEAGGYLDTGDTSRAVGDGGTSFGPFQEHIGGAADRVLNNGGTVADLFDPVSSTDRFIDRYARASASLGAGATPGDVAAAAQRPADPEGYAAKVNAILDSTSSSSATSTSTEGGCPLGWVRVAGVCVPWPGSPAAIGTGVGVAAGGAIASGQDVVSAVRDQITKSVTEPIASAATNLQHGAAQLAIAIGVLGGAALLIYVGARRTLG